MMLHPPPPRLHQAHAAKLKKHIGLSSRKWRQRSTKFISCAVSSPSTKEFIFSGPSPAPAKGLHDNQPLLIQGISWCQAHTRADSALMDLFPKVFPTTSRAKKYCRHHRVFVDGVRASTTSVISPGQHVMVVGRKVHPPNPLLKTVQVLHDDAHICVLVKPEGVFTHGHGRGRTRKSMTHVIERIVSRSAEPDALSKPSPAHRLDKATSGIMTFVKTLRSAQKMQTNFAKDRSVYKRYRAVVTGAIENDCGAFDLPLMGKESLTEYSVVERRFQEHIDQWVTIVDLEPLTGRQHQLRKHLAMAGHPIIGDSWYCQQPGVREEDLFDGWMLHGLYLCAIELKFEHPLSSESLNFQISPPDKYQRPVGRLKKKRRRKRTDTGSSHEAEVDRSLESNAARSAHGQL